MTKVSRDLISVSLLLVVAVIVLLVSACNRPGEKGYYKDEAVDTVLKTAQNHKNIAGAGLTRQTQSIPLGKNGDLIRYGRMLITSTALYFGPNGSVAHISNGMNCQNCHLDAGTRLFANNVAGFTASYP